MKVRKRTLWKVPVFCFIASFIGFYITVYIGGLFFLEKTIGADGITQISVDPVRSDIFNVVLFIGVLLIGGLWAFRKMTKPEIAVSAVITSFIFLLIVLAQLLITSFPISLSVTLAYVQTWTGILASFLMRLTDNFNCSIIISSFAPLLFIPFGRKKVYDE